uniref:TBC1 domain family member 13-like n=1 Tax=Panthera onca TaxID=9690 RepID=UPI0029530706|nr:TBC1 domain family member 13-like [Panthera onca]
MRSAVLCTPHKLEVESCLNGKHFWRERVISAVAASPAPPLFPQMCSPHKNSTPSSLNEYEVLPNGCEAHWEVVERILFIYAKLNPGIAYVQGMNEIVGPLYYTFATDPNSEWKEHAEADTFFCFTNLMAEIRDNFIKSLDDSQCGITYKMEKVYSTLKDKDMELYLKLVRTTGPGQTDGKGHR